MAKQILPNMVNERAARLVAGAVAFTLAAAWLTRTAWVVPLLGVDFVVRFVWGPRFSPLARLAAAAAPRLWDVRPVAGPPKRFAQGIGAACLLLSSALFWAGWSGAAWTLSGLVVLFASLESAIGFCMGCWIYGRLPRRRGVSPACLDCDPPRQSPTLSGAVAEEQAAHAGATSSRS